MCIDNNYIVTNYHLYRPWLFVLSVSMFQNIYMELFLEYFYCALATNLTCECQSAANNL